MHPYHKAGHKQDPRWVKNLNKYVEKAKDDDVKRAVSNYGGDLEATMLAARYERPKNQD